MCVCVCGVVSWARLEHSVLMVAISCESVAMVIVALLCVCRNIMPSHGQQSRGSGCHGTQFRRI